MSLAAFTQPDIVKMVAAAALLCPISYLDHITSPFVRDMVFMHLDGVGRFLLSIWKWFVPFWKCRCIDFLFSDYG